MLDFNNSDKVTVLGKQTVLTFLSTHSFVLDKHTLYRSILDRIGKLALSLNFKFLCIDVTSPLNYSKFGDYFEPICTIDL